LIFNESLGHNPKGLVASSVLSAAAVSFVESRRLFGSRISNLLIEDCREVQAPQSTRKFKNSECPLFSHELRILPDLAPAFSEKLSFVARLKLGERGDLARTFILANSGDAREA
jgi:hypothetical protein